MPEPVDEFWYVSATDSYFCVGNRGSQAIIEQYEAGKELIVFNDLYGKPRFLARKDFIGMHYSTPETRETEREYNRMIADEERAFRSRTGWSEDE